MLNRIPTALLNSRIGGLGLAHEMRKVCFLKEAPVFLREVATLLGVQGAITVDPQLPRQSGRITFTGETVRMAVFEDPGPQNGAQFSCVILLPDGSTKTTHQRFLADLAKGDAWGYFIHAVKNDLASRGLFH